MRILARPRAGERRPFCRASGRKTDRKLSRPMPLPGACPLATGPPTRGNHEGSTRRRRFRRRRAPCVRPPWPLDGPRSGRCGRSWRAWRWRARGGVRRGVRESGGRAGRRPRARLGAARRGAGFAGPGAFRRLCLVHDGLQRRVVGRLALDPDRRQPVARRLVGKPPLSLLAARLAGGRLHPRRRTAGHGGLPPGRDRVRAALHDRPHRRPRPLRRHPRVLRGRGA